MDDVSLDPLSDDIWIEISEGCGYNSSTHGASLGRGVSNLIAFTEKVMCSANAESALHVAQLFEMFARKIRQKYLEWEKNNFEKS